MSGRPPLDADVVVGGGIVGLATAYRLRGARPDLRLTVVQREAALASHQSGHNSGCVHVGVYDELHRSGVGLHTPATFQFGRALEAHAARVAVLGPPTPRTPSASSAPVPGRPAFPPPPGSIRRQRR